MLCEVYEDANSSSSGYDTGHSPGLSVFPMSSAPSPSSALQTDFSHLTLPANSPTSAYQYTQLTPQHQHQQQQQYATGSPYGAGNNYMHHNGGGNGGAGSGIFGENFASPQQTGNGSFPAQLSIRVYPVEKFRFRYKSEMHGTHGSLNGATSSRTTKTFPEVELLNYTGKAVVFCSLFQANVHSPHSHQLVIRKGDVDTCDPHQVEVSPERGYVAQFPNMGIIHTAKKLIYDELLQKKRNRLVFETGRDELSTKEMQELERETAKEAKEMNLNQVRLCFEAFRLDEDTNTLQRIAAPVCTNLINNRKSAQTGELRICRLSVATGSVTGGDDLILLVEKVSKKNIKVLFYEQNEDEEIVWLAEAKFRESDVHHQYAITCETPPYRDQDIDRPVDVMIQLMRPSDDERSLHMSFRYKPRDAVVSRKRRRTCSTAPTVSSEQSSMDVPQTVQEQLGAAQPGEFIRPSMGTALPPSSMEVSCGVRVSEEFSRSTVLLGLTNEILNMPSTELNLDFLGHLAEDGAGSDSACTPPSTESLKEAGSRSSKELLARCHQLLGSIEATGNDHLKRIFRVYDDVRQNGDLDASQLQQAAQRVRLLYVDYAESNERGDSLMHEIVANDNAKVVMKVCMILQTFGLADLLNRQVNVAGESPLHTACLEDRPQYIRPLLRLGCDPNIADNCGNTAMHVAIREHHLNCVESLLHSDGEYPLNVSLKNDEGLSVLHAAIRAKYYDVAEKLVQRHRSAALVPSGKDGNNALHMAVLKQQLPLIKSMLGSEVDLGGNLLNARNTAGYTAYEVAKLCNTNGSGPENAIVQYLMNRSQELEKSAACAPRLVSIKQEEESGEQTSSTEADDEHIERIRRQINDDLSAPLVAIKKEPMEEQEADLPADPQVEIKMEACDPEAASDRDAKNLEIILNDAQKFKELCARLRDDSKWKALATKAKMQHLHFLWSSSEDMLGYIKKKASNIEYQVFAAALAEIDKDALRILQQT